MGSIADTNHARAPDTPRLTALESQPLVGRRITVANKWTRCPAWYEAIRPLALAYRDELTRAR